MRKLACISAVLAVGATPAMARAQTQIVVTSTALASNQTPVSETDLQVAIRGELVVSFRGDPATGCAARGLCDYSGTIIYRPGLAGDISIFKYRIGHRVAYDGSFVAGEGVVAPLTAAQVVRSMNGTRLGMCSDATESLAVPVGSVRKSTFIAPLFAPGGSALFTRCAAPLDGDVTAASPAIRLPLRVLTRGRRKLDLSGIRSFSSHGTAGTVSSTIVITLGTPHTESLGGGGSAPPNFGRPHRVRVITETLAVERAAGTWRAAIDGIADPDACSALDSCGLRGSLAISVPVRRAAVSLAASGPAKRPVRDFLAALGLSRDGNPSGITVAGDIDWGTSGTLATDVRQGAASCRDTGPLAGGDVFLGGGQGRITAEYVPQNVVRTRCPGPLPPSFDALATGVVNRSALARRSFTLRLTATPAFQTDGYFVHPRARFVFVLRRVRLTRQITEQDG